MNVECIRMGIIVMKIVIWFVDVNHRFYGHKLLFKACLTCRCKMKFSTIKMTIYKRWSKSLFLFLIQTKVCFLSEFCDVHIEIKYISSNWCYLRSSYDVIVCDTWRHVTYLKASSSWIVFHVSLRQNLRYFSAVKSIQYLLETRIWN